MPLSLGALLLTIAAVAFVVDIRARCRERASVAGFPVSDRIVHYSELAASVSVVMMERPQMGSNQSGWVWAAKMVGLLPAAAVVLIGESAPVASNTPVHGLACLLAASGFGVFSFAVLTWWLRGGPMSPQSAGLITGIAAGSLGIFAYSFHCTESDIVRIGLWHSVAVSTCAIIDRLAVPRLIGWWTMKLLATGLFFSKCNFHDLVIETDLEGKMSMLVNRFLPVVTTLAATLALAACGSEASPPQAQSQQAELGEVAEIPAAQWIEYEADTFAQAQEKGQTILVDVNATWCPTCKAQAPILDAMRDEEQMGDVVFMKLDFDTEKGFLEEHRIPRQSTIVVFQGEQETARSIAETDPDKLRSAILAGV